MSRFLNGPFFIIAMAALFLAIVLLTSCATVEPARAPQVTAGIKPEVIREPVLIPCIFDDEVPKVPGTWMDATQTKEKRRLAIMADLKQTEAYILTADSLLRGCAKPRTEAPK